MKKRYHYDKVLALGFIASIACILLKMKFSTIMLCLYDFKRKNKLVMSILNTAEKVFVEGKRVKADILKTGVKEDKIVMFQHWCDQSRFQYVVRQHDKLKVLFIGRAIRKKGRHIIEKCEKLTKDIDYEYITSVPYEELPQHYKMADVCVVPSLYSESFSRVVCEAASCGCVVIASNYGSLPEMVEPFGKCITPTAKNFARELTKLKENRLKLEGRQVTTAWYAKRYFGEENTDCFLL